jgi:hypothetical protein
VLAAAFVVAMLAWTAPQAPASADGTGSAAPFDPAAAVRRGCEILLAAQEGEGRREWPYEGVYRTVEPGADEPVIPIGYRVGGTSIACLALLAAPGYAEAEGAERRAAVARGVEFVLEALELPRMEAEKVASYDVRGWGFVYALALFVELERRGATPEAHAAALEKAVPRLVRALEETALAKVGGWNYSGRDAPAPFMTAPALQALFAARAAGQKVSSRVLEEALDSLERGRARSGSIAYATPAKARAKLAEDELAFMDKLEGSMGRMLAAESTLTLFGRGDPERLSTAVRAFFAHWDELEKRRQKTGTHVEPFGVAPYYVMYAHLHAARAIEQLADPAERAAQRAELLRRLASIQEREGGWNDRVFPRSLSFGTAMAMLALLQAEIPGTAR